MNTMQLRLGENVAPLGAKGKKMNLPKKAEGGSENYYISKIKKM